MFKKNRKSQVLKYKNQIDSHELKLVLPSRDINCSFLGMGKQAWCSRECQWGLESWAVAGLWAIETTFTNDKKANTL